MKLTKEHLYNLLLQLPTDLKCDYVKPGKYQVQRKDADGNDIRFSLFENGQDSNKDVSVTENAMETMASYIQENRPITIDAALDNGGNKRSAIEGAIICTSEFYSINIGKNKNIVWVPSMPHTVGERGIWPENKELPLSSSEDESVLGIKQVEVRDDYTLQELGSFLASMKKEGEEAFGIGVVCQAFGFKYGKAIAAKDYKSNAIINEANNLGANINHTHDGSVNEGVKLYQIFSRQFFGLHFTNGKPKSVRSAVSVASEYRPYITAIKSKPFLLLAGISGTGKSRIVRELARACWDVDSPEYQAQKPKNFEMVQVKPNWHDSSDLIGYVSRVSGKAEYIAGDFLKFVAKAWEHLDTPYFLCLDEMNLAPVEQYFAEYLSVVESRKAHEGGVVTTDPILAKADEEWYFSLTAALTADEEVRSQFNRDGICLPQNLIIVGTVNMDETTFSFSRKVLDRAMTIEMNEVDLYGGLEERHETIGKLGCEELVGTAVEGVDVYEDNKDVCDAVLNYLGSVNACLENTPFKVAYRTRNEFLLYVVNNLPYSKDSEGHDLPLGYVMARALDEITSMKILSRIEGDDTKVSDAFLSSLAQVIENGLNAVSPEKPLEKSVSLSKIREMRSRLASGYTSFWS